MNTMQKCQEEYYEYIIIGAGIGGLQAAKILAENYEQFIIIEASDVPGGRIATDKLGDIIKNKQKQGINLNWISENQQAMQVMVDYGATWISLEHKLMLQMVKDLGIQTYTQYFDGLTIYGVGPDNYEKVESLTDYYKNYKKDIQKLLDKIDAIKTSFETLIEQNENRSYSGSIDDLGELKSPLLKKKKISEYSMLNEYIEYYDHLTVRDFIRNQLKNQFLSDQILNEIEMLQCISCDRFSMIQLFDDDTSLQLLKLYCQKVENSIDGMKVKTGMITVIHRLIQQIIDELKEECDYEVKMSDFIRLNSPVIKIENEIGEDIRVHIKNSNKVYIGGKILFSAPIAVANQIQITKISPSKKLIFENQELGNVTRVYLVFEQAFWRGKYSGYGSFSSKFPFNEMTDLSPSNLACGILVFIFIGDKYAKWIEEYPSQKQQESLLKDIIAKMFLNGNNKSPYLENMLMYKRNFSTNPYIRAAYQSTTKPHIWKEIKDNGDDYLEAYVRDQYGIVYIGSQFAEEHGTYMEGALRLSRKKIYHLLQKKDPWSKLLD